MIVKALKKVRRLIKEPGLDLLYSFLMSPASRFQGRRLFDSQELRNIHRALLNQTLFGIDGAMVSAFEKEFAAAYDVPYAVAATSGTAAIHTALGALDLNPGDEVITAPITDMGTIIPILYQNAIPVFADIDNTYNMDPAEVEKNITSRTKAILVVHLFGNPCNMEAMAEIATQHNIPLIEDCAQAHMTAYKGRYVGTIGDIGCFSFQQSKHMTTGDGGMVITSNKGYYEKMKLFVDKNYARKGWGARAYVSLAPNYRMNELTAAVGRAQLAKVKAVVQKRHALGEYLTKKISGIPNVLPAPVTEGSSHGYWLYPMTLKDLDLSTFAEEMKKEGAWVSAGYTVKPIYLCTEALTNRKTYGQSGCPFTCKLADKNYEYKEGLCPKAEDALRHLIGVPIDESMSIARIDQVSQAIAYTVQKLKGSTDRGITADFGKPVAFTAAINKEGTRTIRIGIVGCGQMGEWHFSSYRKNPKVKLTAFVDTDLRKAELFARKIGAKAYSSTDEMLKHEELDGASICTIPATHKDIALDLLGAGINVLCEKPLAISVVQARDMVKTANEKRLLLFTAYKFRFFEEVSKAKELITSGNLGKIISFRLMFGGDMDMSGTWYANPEVSGGGVIIDTASHALDLTSYLFGEVESIKTKVNKQQNIAVEDTANLELTLKNYGHGMIDISWSLPVPALSYLEIFGTEGAALLDFKGISYRLKTWGEWKRIENKGNPKQAFSQQIENFVNAMTGAVSKIIANEDGLKTQQLIEMAYNSIT